MLAAAQRLRRREDFAATIRNGRRAGRGAVVVHFLNPGSSRPGVEPSSEGPSVAVASGELSPVVAGLPPVGEGSPVGEASSVGEASPVVGGLEAFGAARAGFVVSKAVGGAVVRNAVKRRLRHLVRERIADLPAGSVIVVRALPEAASVQYDILARDLDAALEAARRPKSRGGRR